jgi:AbrB family looped-hinge helix DNA binding protein
MIQDVSRVGQRGTIVVPVSLRRRFGLKDGTFVAVEEHEEGILIRPVVVEAIEMYGDRRKAEFLLNNAVDAADYAAAVEAVTAMGIAVDTVPHRRPEGGP